MFTITNAVIMAEDALNDYIKTELSKKHLKYFTCLLFVIDTMNPFVSN